MDFFFYESAYNLIHDMNPDIRWNALDSDPPRMKRKVVRWKLEDAGFFLQTSTRQYEYQDTAKFYIGFRCVIDLQGQLRKSKFNDLSNTLHYFTNTKERSFMAAAIPPKVK